MNKFRKKKLCALVMCLLMLMSLLNNVAYYPEAESLTTRIEAEIATLTDSYSNAVIDEGVTGDIGEKLKADAPVFYADDIRDLPNPSVKVVTYVNGVPTDLTDSTVLNDGDKIDVRLTWAVSNTDSNKVTTGTVLKYDLNATGVIIKNTSGKLMDGPLEVGDFWIDDNGMFNIQYTDADFIDSDIEGGVTINAVIDVAGLPVDDQGKTKIEIAGVTIPVKKNNPAVSPGINKNKGSVYSENGKNYQSFEVKIDVNSDADELVFTDTLGEYLSLAGTTININGTNVSPDISGKEIRYSLFNVKKGETYTIKYITEIDDRAFSSDYSWYVGDNKYYNKARVEDSNGESNNSSIFALSTKTWINKSNSVDSNTNTINWTITVNGGNDIIDISGAVVKDVIPADLTVIGDVTISDSQGNPTTISADELKNGYTFPEGSVGKYTITYKTNAPESSSLVGTEYKNTASITDDRYNVNKSDSSTAKIVADWIGKEVYSVDLENNIITWKTVINVPDTATEGKDLKYIDTFATSGMTYVNDSISVDYDKNENVTGGWSINVIDPSSGFEVTLGTVKGPTTITIMYQTEFDPGTQKIVEYINRGKITDGTDTSKEVEAKYSYKTTEIDILQYKDGASGSGTISTWRIQIVNTNQLADRVNAGEKIYIYDKISLTKQDGTELGFNSRVKVVDNSIVVNDTATDLITAEVLGDGRIRFDITEYIRANPYSSYYVLGYSVDLDSETIGGMLENNITSIKESNYAEAKGDKDGTVSDLGDVVGNGSTYPTLGTLLTKSYDYTSSTAPYALYTIDINPNGYDLVSGDGTLTLEDVHGADLQLVLSSVMITDKNGNEINSVVIDYFLSERKLVISNIPDATPCHLTYKVLVNVEYQDDTSFESIGADVSNVCRLYSESADVASAGSPITGNIQKSDGWSTSNYGSIVISKHDGAIVLGDAEFSIDEYKYDNVSDAFVASETGYNNVITNTTDGTAVLNRLQLDTLYKITEVTAPDGYVAKGESIYVIIKGNDFDSLVNAITKFEEANTGITIDVHTNGSYLYVENEPAGLSINVNKNDQNDAPVQGAEFTLYREGDTDGVCDVEVETKATNEHGKVVFANLTAGKYRIVETLVPEGYTGSYDSGVITLDGITTTINLDAENEKLYGSCEITKKGSDGELLKDVEFGLYLDDVLIKNAKTNESGKIVFTDLELGKAYVVKELTGIYGYNLTDGPWTKTLTAGDRTWIINAVNDKQNGKIKIVKKDKDNAAKFVEGAVFTLYDKNKNVVKDSANNPVTGTTNASGEIIFDNLPYDEYYVRETEAPSDYLLDGTFHKVNVTSDTVVIVQLTNKAKTLTIPYISFWFNKQGNSTDGIISPLAGAEFALYRDGVVVDTAISDDLGHVYFMNVTYFETSRYKIVEENAPEGYDKDDSTIEFSGSDIASDVYGHHDVYAAGDKDSIKELVIAGAPVTFVNEQLKGAIKLIKTDEEGEVLQGAVYGAFKNGSQVAVGTSDRDGVINFTNLVYGDTYTIKEITPPDGYILSNKEFVIRIGDTTAESGYKGITTEHVCSYELEAEDGAIKLNISKKAITGADEVAGANLVLKEDNGLQIDAWISGSTAHTVSSNKLKVNAIYILEEIKAPDGYGYSDPVRFKINADNSITILNGSDANSSVSGYTITMRDRDISFKLAKVDSSGNRIGGAGLNIQIVDGMDGKVLYHWNSVSGSDLVITAQSAKQYGIKVPDTPGTYKEYVYHETSAPEGYLPAADITFYLDCYGQVYVKDDDGNYVEALDNRLVMVDEIDTTDVLISKVKSDGKTHIRNAKLKIVDSGNNVIAEWNSAYTAKVLDGSLFNIGETYTLIEVEPATGYAYTDPITFKINDDGKVEIAGNVIQGNHIYMRDASIKVMLNKVDGTDGLPVKGAKIEIYNESGVLVTSYETNGSGYDVGKVLKAGQDADTGLRKYTMHEAEAPFGYEVAADIHFAIDDKGRLYLPDENGDYVLSSVQEITMKDSRVYLGVSKLNNDSSEFIPNAKLAIKDNAGTTVVSWTTGSDAYKLDLTKLKAHTASDNNIYTLCELSAPFGYAKADDIQFYVNKNYELYVNQGSRFVKDADGILTMLDENAVLTISKVDAVNSDEIEGAKLIITDEDGNVIAEWTSVKGESKKLDILGNFEPNKLYTLTEVSAPYGYEVAESIEFKIAPNGKVMIKNDDGSFTAAKNSTIVMKDAPTYLNISKVDFTNGDELPGAKLTITDANGNLVDTWTSSDTAHLVPVKTFEPGVEYTLTEVVAPDGYEIAESIIFKLDEDGNVYVKDADGNFVKVKNDTIVMKDKPVATDTTETTVTTETSSNTTTETSTNTITEGGTARTGDNTPIAILVIIMLLAALGCMLLGIRRSRR